MRKKKNPHHDPTSPCHRLARRRGFEFDKRCQRNYGIPYRLKHYIDIVTLPGQNWSWTRAEGYQPLLRGKRAALVYSSAGDFSQPAASSGAYEDFQKPFMRQWLRSSASRWWTRSRWRPP
jgi:hypothetical protein